jgi:hypothetical protein
MTPLEQLEFVRDAQLMKIRSLGDERGEEASKLASVETVLEWAKAGEIDIRNGLDPVIARMRREVARAQWEVHEFSREIRRLEEQVAREEDRRPPRGETA